MRISFEKIKFIGNILLLLILYIMQGIPLGCADILPFIIQTRGANYPDLAIFSLTGWPFSLKILWAPIVDAVHFKSIGRRKSWVVLTQLLIGAIFIYISRNINYMLDNIHNKTTIIHSTIIFTILTFLSATQDIAVDGWGLNLLPRKHLHLASTCNTIGQTIGYLIGNLCFLILTSPDILNGYFRSKDQILTEEKFFLYSGLCYIIITLLVLIFKREKEGNVEDISSYKSIKNSYMNLQSFVTIPAIFKICSIILIVKFCFAATDSLVIPKIVEAGLTRKDFTLLAIPSFFIQLIASVIANSVLRFYSPLKFYIYVFPFRIAFGIFSMGFIYWVQKYAFKFHRLFYYSVLLHSTIHQILIYFQFIPLLNFFALIVDPLYGASQMTLLNTVSNFAHKWPQTLLLYSVDYLTFRKCGNEAKVIDYKSCPIYIDGFYIISIVCTLCGILWWKYCRTLFLNIGLESVHYMGMKILEIKKDA